MPRRPLSCAQNDWKWEVILLRTSNAEQQDLGAADSEAEQLRTQACGGELAKEKAGAGQAGSYTKAAEGGSGLTPPPSRKDILPDGRSWASP